MGPGPDHTDIYVSAIGQADDTVDVSDCLTKLSGLVYLTEQYCDTFHVELVPEKTRLLMYTPAGQHFLIVSHSFTCFR